MMNIPDPNAVFPNEYKTSCFIKNVVTAPNITVGDYTYYDDAVDPTGFERNNVLFNYPEFGDHLVIGKFCQIASGTKFIMGESPHQQRHDVSIQRLRRRLNGKHAAAHGAASAQGRHDHRKRRVDRARGHHYARREDRRRRNHRRLFRGGERRACVHRLRREPGEIHQGAI